MFRNKKLLIASYSSSVRVATARRIYCRCGQTAAYYPFLFTEFRRRGTAAMKNFLGALLLALKNFLKAIIVRAAGASGIE